MRMVVKVVCFAVAILPGLAPAVLFGAQETAGKVTAVTVYQGQALVTRTVQLEGGTGLVEIIVTGLPENVLPPSLYAEPGAGVAIRSVRYRIRPVEADVREEVRELDAQLQDLADQLAEVARHQQLNAEQLQYLQKLEQFTTVTADQELKNGVLNAETLKELTSFNFEKRTEIATSELELAKQQRELQKQIELLQRKRQTIAAGSARTVREAIVFVNVTEEAASPSLRLRYLVSKATWSPSYNLRATAERDEVLVEYNASIEQMSGEDWTDVEMTLSTASPSLVAQAPTLDPLVVKLGHMEPAQVASSPASGVYGYKQAKENLELQRRQLEEGRGNVASNLYAGSQGEGQAQAAPAQANEPARGGGGSGGGAELSDRLARDRKAADKVLNEISQQMQLLDLNMAQIETKKPDEAGLGVGEGVSVSYRLASRMTLPSRSDRQLLQISAHKLKGEFYRVAIPVLTSSVYEEVRLVNDSDQVFLAGPTSTFLGDEFVGRGEMPTVSIGESFTAGLGIDSSLRVRRELADKVERTQGGNRVVDFTYTLLVENFGSQEVKLRLLDRMPTAGEADMKLTLVSSDKPVSDDREYRLKGHTEGLLRWDIEVPAKSAGVDRVSFKYTMQIEYDKQLSIVGLPSKE